MLPKPSGQDVEAVGLGKGRVLNAELHSVSGGAAQVLPKPSGQDVEAVGLGKGRVLNAELHSVSGERSGEGGCYS